MSLPSSLTGLTLSVTSGNPPAPVGTQTISVSDASVGANSIQITDSNIVAALSSGNTITPSLQLNYANGLSVVSTAGTPYVPPPPPPPPPVILDTTNNVTLKYTLSSIPSGQSNPYIVEVSGTYYAVMSSNNSDSKSKITAYATNFSQSITNPAVEPFVANGTKIPFNRIVTTLMTDLSWLFFNSSFNEDINSWDTSNVTNMTFMFYLAQNFNLPINSWNTSNVTHMSNMFQYAYKFNQDIGSWNTSKVTSMSYMFINAYKFNKNIGGWDTSKVTNMSNMFAGAEVFNNNGSPTIGNWDTSNVTDMSSMFSYAYAFNQNISSWNVQNVSTKPPNGFSSNSQLTTAKMPYWYLSFDANGVTIKSTLPSLPSSPMPLFVKANLRGTPEWFAIVDNSLAANITNYANGITNDAGSQKFIPTGQTPPETTPVPFRNIVTTFMTNMSALFSGTSSFNSDISSWDTSRVTNMDYMFNGASAFNKNISSWDVYNLSSKPEKPIGFSNASLFNNYPENMPVWSSLFLDTTNNVTIKTTLLSFSSATPIFIKANPRGTGMEWFAVVNNSTAANITNYAKGITTDGSSKFIPTGQTPPETTPVPFKNIVTTQLTSMNSMFLNTSSFNSDISSWDTSRVTNMSQMFTSSIQFNSDISNWNTSRVTTMSAMFSNAPNFNKPIGSWDTSRVTNMSQMFGNAVKFNVNINNWNTSKVTDMSSMFNGASEFNSPIGSWDTSSVTNMYAMFNSASEFNIPIGSWNTSKVTNMNAMFIYARKFNQNINYNQSVSTTAWNTSKVTDMSSMFRNASAFNSDISSWDTSMVTNMTSMFNTAEKFNININNWNTSKVTDMTSMFQNAFEFNNPIGSWNTSNVTNMRFMFANAIKFNQNINYNQSVSTTAWNTSKVTDMYFMFVGASVFSQDISGWIVTNVTPKPPQGFSTNSGLTTAQLPLAFR